MHSDSDNVIRAKTRAQGLRIKRNNLIAAFLSGLMLVLISVKFVAPSRPGFLLGLLVGFVYANGFEYCLHRFLLHCGHGVFSQQHMVHHTTLQSPDAARYVNFSSNPWGVVALFLANSIPFLILQWITHMGGWLPQWLRPAARHHMLHHAHGSDRFNVFLPFFDWIIDSVLGAPVRRR